MSLATFDRSTNTTNSTNPPNSSNMNHLNNLNTLTNLNSMNQLNHQLNINPLNSINLPVNHSASNNSTSSNGMNNSSNNNNNNNNNNSSSTTNNTSNNTPSPSPNPLLPTLLPHPLVINKSNSTPNVSTTSNKIKSPPSLSNFSNESNEIPLSNAVNLNLNLNLNHSINGLNSLNSLNNLNSANPIKQSNSPIQNQSTSNNNNQQQQQNPSLIMLPPLATPFLYNLQSNTQSDSTAINNNNTNSTIKSSSANTSGLPPLFKLAHDSSINQQGNNQQYSSNQNGFNNYNSFNSYFTQQTQSHNIQLPHQLQHQLQHSVQNNQKLQINQPNFDASLLGSLGGSLLGSNSLKRTSSMATLEQPSNESDTTKRQIKLDSSPSSKPLTHQPRKKRECPICHQYFSNLTTHKAIHNKDSKPYVCATCNRPFKRLNDLIRHEKCHLSQLGEWEYQCPFHPGSDLLRSNRGEICHHTGYFTRCDTYKNHLKAIHFRYPPNTLKSERSKVGGHCRECNEYFENVQEWLTKHIETNQCPKMINQCERKKR